MKINVYLFRDNVDKIRTKYGNLVHIPELTDEQWEILPLSTIRLIYRDPLEELYQKLDNKGDRKTLKCIPQKGLKVTFNDPFQKLRRFDLVLFEELHEYVESQIPHQMLYKSKKEIVSELIQKYNFYWFVKTFANVKILDIISMDDQESASFLGIDKEPLFSSKMYLHYRLLLQYILTRDSFSEYTKIDNLKKNGLCKIYEEIQEYTYFKLVSTNKDYSALFNRRLLTLSNKKSVLGFCRFVVKYYLSP
jgi:hypothetical protein